MHFRGNKIKSQEEANHDTRTSHPGRNLTRVLDSEMKANSHVDSHPIKGKDLTEAAKSLIFLVGLEGFEPSAN